MIRSKTIRLMLPILSLPLLAVLGPQRAVAHCEVPCGIFADQLRFESMLEDQATIAKANVELAAHLASMAEEVTPLAVNQATRWIKTKEEHAERIQHTVAQYFMAQRIKPEDGAGQAGYVKKLTAAHAVMRAAMKAKQDPSSEVASALRTAILDLYRAYEGKEPEFH